MTDERPLLILLALGICLISTGSIVNAKSASGLEDYGVETIDDADTELIEERFEDLNFDGKLKLLRSLYEANQVYEYAQSLLRDDSSNTGPFNSNDRLKEFTESIRRTLRNLLEDYTDRLSFESQYREVLKIMKLEDPNYKTEEARKLIERFNRVLSEHRSSFRKHAVISALGII